MNFRAAIVAEGYCQEVGFDSSAAGKYCRAKGITLEEIKRFSAWLAQHDGDVVLSASARAREQELINKVSELNESTNSKTESCNAKKRHWLKPRLCWC
jgi:DNA-binding transcriptional MerR regulator